MEIIEVKLDEENELFFAVKLEGTVSAPVSVRLVCEADDFSAVFVGSYTDDGEVKVTIPEMKRNASFKENKDYVAQLEVMVENRFFIPLKFGLKFKETLKVFAEVVTKQGTVLESAQVPVKKLEAPIEIKKAAPSVTANIIVKHRQLEPVIAQAIPQSSLKETVEKRKKDIFERLSKLTK
jgi:hypothetical protein